MKQRKIKRRERKNSFPAKNDFSNQNKRREEKMKKRPQK